MINKIWAMATLVERYNYDNEPVLWGECMRLLEGNPNQFLEEEISNVPEVNDGFLEAKTWLRIRGLNVENGTLIYALQCTAYKILLKAINKENMPKNLNNEWLESKRSDLKSIYSKISFFSKNSSFRANFSNLFIGPNEQINERQLTMLFGVSGVLIAQFFIMFFELALSYPEPCNKRPGSITAEQTELVLQGIKFLRSLSLVLILLFASVQLVSAEKLNSEYVHEPEQVPVQREEEEDDNYHIVAFQ